MLLRTISKAVGYHLGTRNAMVASVQAVAGNTAATDLIAAATLTAKGTNTKFWVTDIVASTIVLPTAGTDAFVAFNLLAGATVILGPIPVGGANAASSQAGGAERFIHLKFEKPLLFDTSAGTAVRYSTSSTGSGSATVNLTVSGFWTSDEDDRVSF